MSYDWIKPGVKYRVVAEDYGHQFDIGEVVTHTGKLNLFTNGMDEWYLFPEEVEPVHETPSNTLVVGGKYTSKNGYNMICISIVGDRAWLAMYDNTGPTGAAYSYNTDGTSVCLGGGEWNIAFKPREEWVDTRFYGSVRDKNEPNGVKDFSARIRFKMIDGKPDWSTAVVSD